MKLFDSKTRIAVEVNMIILDRIKMRNASLIPMSNAMRFYYDRLRSLYMYSLYQAREIVKMICRCAFNDSSLTDMEAIVIMETCLDSRLDNILMEVNYNEGW